MKRLIIIAAALVIVANAAVLARVAYNRSGVAQTITLTERELTRPYNYRHHNKEENSGLHLVLEWNVAQPEIEQSWRYDQSMTVDEQKFLQFGFQPVENCEEPREQRGGHDKSRKAWAVLEYDGPAHANLLRKLRQLPLKDYSNHADALRNRAEELERLERRDTRLYVIDIAADKEELAARYRDSGQVILPAKVSNYSNCDKKHTLYVEVLSRYVNVPAQYHSFFAQVPERSYLGDKELPAYRAEIAIGKLNEPWLLKLEAIENPQP
jgi:hypothetical protein